MKIWKKSLAVLLILVLAISLCACGASEEDKLVGTWKCEYDMTDFANKSVAEGLGEDLEIDAEMVFPMTLTMNEDRSCTLEVDGDAFIASFQGYLEGVMDVLVDALCENAGMTREEMDAVMQEQYGMSAADYCKEMFGSMFSDEEAMAEMKEQMKEASSSGTYSVKDGKLVITDEDGEAEECAYTLEGDTLTLVYDGLEVLEGLSLDTLIFKKA